MRRSPARACVLLLAAVTLTGLTATAAEAKKTKLAQATLNGSGSSFQLGFNQVVIGAFKQDQKSVTVNYLSKGSGTGRQEFSDGVTDFGGTDGLFPASAPPKGGAFLYFPTVVAPIDVVYNLPGIKGLKLSGETTAKIFQRQITTWNDAAIKAENPTLSLPGASITVAHRSDGSGTTEQFTKFLVKSAPSTWTLGSGSTVQWPADTSGAPQNAGVSQIVKTTQGAVGYVDHSDAIAVGLATASMKNAEGKYVTPSLSGASASLAGITVNADLTYDPIFAPGATAYPITAPTWIVVYKSQTNKAKGEALKAFLNFIYGKGQTLAPTVDYAPLPKSLLKQSKDEVNQISVATS
jgi:phosphate transport system substrate-binding protein